MFKRIFVENELRDNERVIDIRDRLHTVPVSYIDKIEDVFERVRKPYLLKRRDLSIFLGVKKGKKIRESPAFYGLAEGPHYLLMHAYNCVHECAYCYLQGYFNSPDIVLYLNYEDFASEIEAVANATPPGRHAWFHAGEYSDSLALSHLSGALPFFFELFERLPRARLELRTKSTNLKILLERAPLPNIVTSFTLAPQQWVDRYEYKTTSVKSRIHALGALSHSGHPIAVHFDPIIYHEGVEQAYRALLEQILDTVSSKQLEYLSLGVVRFTKRVFNQIRNNYPDSALLAAEFVKGNDGKVSYNRPMRFWLLNKIKTLCLDAGIKEEKIYLCMQDDPD
jgi:spore photoproduct lyase